MLKNYHLIFFGEEIEITMRLHTTLLKLYPFSPLSPRLESA